MLSSNPDHSQFHKHRHIKYWLRCLKTHLPNAYTSNDSQRVTLAFFILSALDLLGVLHEHTSPAERAEYAGWILRCQHPNGGFRGFTGTMVEGDQRPCEWDAANLAATYFALAALAVLGEGTEQVKSKECFEWVRSLQRKNGSFGEGVGKNGSIEGAEDMRFSQLAAGIRWFLRRGEMDSLKDINVESLVGWIQESVTYEGGIAQSPFHEAHAGLTYAGVSALSLLGRLPRKGTTTEDEKTMSPDFIDDLTRWLVSRQTLVLHEDEEMLMAEEEPLESGPVVFPPKFHVMGSHPVRMASPAAPERPAIEFSPEEMLYVGVNGRCNKVADTCYTFWVGGSLGILNKVYLQDFNGIRRYLLEKTQHMIGGFGKMPGDLPGINSINSLNMGNSASIPRDVGADEFPSLLNTADSPSMRIAPGEHDVQMHDTMGDIPSARPIGGSVMQLQPDIKDLLGWEVSGDDLCVRLNVADAIDYKVNKSLAYNQSKYFRNCLTASQKDRYPYVSCRLNDPLPEDVASFHVIMLWFANLPIGAGAFRDWCEDHEDLSLKDWCNVYTLAEELQIPRLEQHVSGAIKLKVMEDRILPSLANVKYIYSNGKKFCGLKHTFRDMYAIAAMEPKEVFGRDKVRFPPEFVWDVEAFNQSEAYVERRKAMMACERLDLGEEGEEGNGVGGDVDQEMTG